ncbi:MAG: 16S rRNA (guanine(966)-N(2))-methyltransferase RsmD [Clostridia bacterium]|nr:16S rRNA (guanine(966)-N(2))-methyltransferase RsmD [Clostridia bacterium]
MRIVSGKYRGKILKEFELNSTKPTTDRVKEAIFNLIQFDVVDSVVLDLFSGTGALGIEAISRGAKKVFLNDINSQSVKLIKENLKGIEGDYSISSLDYQMFLNTSKQKFDIVFLDPPYKTNFGLKAIDLLIENKLLTENAIIIFETSEENNFNLSYEGFEIKKKKYGKIIVFKMEKF